MQKKSLLVLGGMVFALAQNVAWSTNYDADAERILAKIQEMQQKRRPKKVSLTQQNAPDVLGFESEQALRNATIITIPAHVEKIKKEALNGLTKLTTVQFENGSKLEKIGKQAFNDCTGLKEITLPTSVEKVKKGAFNGCTQLGTIIFKVGDNDLKIEPGALGGCSSLVTIIFVGVDAKTAQLLVARLLTTANNDDDELKVTPGNFIVTFQKTDQRWIANVQESHPVPLVEPESEITSTPAATSEGEPEEKTIAAPIEN